MNLCIRFNKILLLTTITSIFIYVILGKIFPKYAKKLETLLQIRNYIV